MKMIKKTAVLIITAALVFFTAHSTLYGAAGGSGAPWFPSEFAAGRYEYEGTLYIDFVDSGRGNIPGGIGDKFGEPYQEEVVYINFFLVLYPIRPSAEPLFFAGTGKTCEPYENPQGLPVCPAGADRYNELFYIPGDYALRIGAAALTFYRETVFPALCGSRECGDLKSAVFDQGSGNAEQVVDPRLWDPDQPEPPWYYVQPVTFVTRP